VLNALDAAKVIPPPKKKQATKLRMSKVQGTTRTVHLQELTPKRQPQKYQESRKLWKENLVS
jgi:hypothetical protein